MGWREVLTILHLISWYYKQFEPWTAKKDYSHSKRFMTKLSVIYCMDIDPPVTSHSYGKWSIYIYIYIYNHCNAGNIQVGVGTYRKYWGLILCFEAWIINRMSHLNVLVQSTPGNGLTIWSKYQLIIVINNMYVCMIISIIIMIMIIIFNINIHIYIYIGTYQYDPKLISSYFPFWLGQAAKHNSRDFPSLEANAYVYVSKLNTWVTKCICATVEIQWYKQHV